jgi:hypothetical protein
MAGIKSFVVGFILVILMSWVLLGFITNFLIATNPSSEILEGEYGITNISNSFNDTLSEFTTKSQEAYGQMDEATPSPVEYIFLIFSAAFYIPKSFLSLIGTGLVGLKNLLFMAFGASTVGAIVSVIVTLFVSVTITTAVFLLIKAIRTGESER